MTSKNEIESLIYLLEDPDPAVQNGVKSRFRELGENAVPLLDQYRSESVHDSEKKTVNEIIYSITAGSVFEQFSDILEEGVANRRQLERAVLQLSKIDNPTLRVEDYSRKLDLMAKQIGSDIAYTPSLNEKMHILLQYVFRELRFRGDSKDYHNPENALFDRVMERRKGLPIMLSLVIIFIARRLSLPFYGVNMPIHFIMMYETHNQQVLIDPFDGGTLVSYDQCCYFLKKNGIEPRPEHLEKADELSVLARCIRNLIHSYGRSPEQEEVKVKDLTNLLSLVEQRT